MAFSRQIVLKLLLLLWLRRRQRSRRYWVHPIQQKRKSLALPREDTNVSEVKEDEEDEEEEEMEESSGAEEDESLQKAKQAITCRSVTLQTLMEDEIIEPGEGLLSIDYLGQRFEADLLKSGKIKWQGSQEEFGTPSAWALHCKRLVNPIKRSGCGWASVKYRNKKLDIWKSIWARKHRNTNPFKSPHHSSTTSPSIPSNTSSQATSGSANPTVISSGGSVSSKPLSSHETTSGTSLQLSVSTKENTAEGSELKKRDENPTNLEMRSISSAPLASGAQTQSQAKKPRLSHHEETPLNLSTVLPTVEKKQNSPRMSSGPKVSGQLDGSLAPKERKSVSYSALGTRALEVDSLTLVKCENFDKHSKIQPFTVSVTSNTLLLMDFHCHLTKSEVVGYLGGRWDSHKQHLSIEQCFPACCRLGDKDRAPLVEEEIRRSMRQKNQMVVGWYHSHPHCQADPSVKDVDSQMSYQLKMRGSGSVYLPCLGFILSPFEKYPPKQDSKIQAFWVMPNLENPSSYNIPMHVSYSISRDSSLTEDILSDMKHLTEFYSGALDKVQLKDHWGEAITYLDKIKASLRSKLPEDQLNSGTFLDYVQQLLRDMK